MDVWAVFLTGLFAGGLTCMAVQGGLLASTIAQQHEEKLQKGHALPLLIFLLAKLFAYTLLGAVLGWIGSLFQFSLLTRIIIQALISLFMIGVALNLLRVHPFFRYFIIQPPFFLTRFVRQQSKNHALYAPALLGLLTVFIPCGATQAVMALAIGSGTPLVGATVLFAFTLGTMPLFFVLGYFASRLGTVFQKGFNKVAAYSILGIAIWSLNGAVALTGSPITLETIAAEAYCTFSICERSLIAQNIPSNQQTLYIENQGYSPNNFSIYKGQPVTLHLKNETGQGCTQSFTIPSLGIQKVVPLGQEETVTFTAPVEPQTIAFMCGMGMYRGTITVI